MDNTQSFIRHISLCAGYGGIDLGLRRVLPECRTVAYVEIEAFAIQNLVNKIDAQQLDAAPVHTNIKTFPFRQFRGCVDILSGGFPCQPFSQAGKKKGVEDERHLWPFIERGIEQCRPSVVFFENVNGIISTKTGNGDSVLKYVLTSLEQLGYCATAGVFSAEEIGAPHQRKRVFILADSTNLGCGGRISSGKHQRDRSVLSEEHQRTELVSQTEGCRGKSGEQCDSQLANSDSTLRLDVCGQFSEQRQKTQQRIGDSSGSTSECYNAQWPSRPNEPQYDWEEPRVISSIKSKLGGTANGSASGVDTNQNRIDRLRLLGNGVVPGVAEKAFRVLWERLV